MYFSRKMILLSFALLLLFFATFTFIFISNTEEIATGKNKAFLEEVKTVSENFYLLEKRRSQETLDNIVAGRNIQKARNEKELKRYLRFLLEKGEISGAKIENSKGVLLASPGNPGVIAKKVEIARENKTVTLEKTSPTIFLTELRSLTGKEFSLWQGGQLLASTLAGQALPEKGERIEREGNDYRLDHIKLDDLTLAIALEEEGFTWELPQTSLLLLLLLLLLFLLLQFIIRRNSKKQISLILAATRDMRQGNYQSEIPKTSSKEINLLAKEMGRMGQEISSLIASLRQAKEKLEETIKKSGKVFAVGPNEKESFRLLLDLAIQASGADGGLIENSKRGDKYTHSLSGQNETIASELLEVTGHGKKTEEQREGVYLIALPLFAFQEITGGLVLYKQDPFTENDRNALDYLTSQAQIALENNELHARLKLEASTDDLTGLANRRTIRATMEKELERSLRFQRSFAVMLIDVDNFKKINDQYGHSEGDIVLREIAKAIEKSLRHIDLVARWGGEEFLVLLPETDTENALQAAERLLKTTRSSLPITLSIGISIYPENSENIDDLIILADQAMYQAKKDGKDCAHLSP